MRCLFDFSGHAVGEALQDFAMGTLGEEETLLLAEHIGSCEACAEKLADVFENTKLAEVPPGFAEEVHRRLPAPSKKSRIELVYFSMRVAFAACAALFIIFSGSMRAAAGAQNPFAKISAPGFSTVNGISTGMRDFSQQLIHMEAIIHAKEKK